MRFFNASGNQLVFLATVLALLQFVPSSSQATIIIKDHDGNVIPGATSITMAELLASPNQASIQVDGTIFENWRGFDSSASGGTVAAKLRGHRATVDAVLAAVVPIDAAQLTVTATGEGTCTPGPGVSLVSTQFVVQGIAESQVTAFTYDIRAVSGAAVIDDVGLSLGGFAVTLAGTINVFETIQDQNQTVIGILTNHVDSVTPPSSAVTQAVAPPQAFLTVTKSIQLSNGGAEDQGSAVLGAIGQDFSQACGSSLLVINQIACLPCTPGAGCETLAAGAYTGAATGLRTDTTSPIFCYSVTVTNTGAEALQNVLITDDTGLDLTDCFPGGVTNGFTLAAGAAVNCFIAVNRNADTTNTVTAAGDGAASQAHVTSSASATAQVTQATIACPANVTVQCAADVPAPVAVTATVNCNEQIAATSQDEVVPGNCPNRFTIHRTYTASDQCNNTVSCLQTITVNDTTAPVLSGVPADLAIQCGSVPPPAAVTATDNCDGPLTPAFQEAQSNPGSSCSNIITRTWTVTDACGNSATATQTIAVGDTTPPVLAGVPADVTVQCLGDVAPPAEVTANDECAGAVTPVLQETQSNPGSSCSNIITRTWTATDTCGNIATATQTITVNDTTLPVLSGVPADASVQCLADVPAPAAVTANDNCAGALTPAFQETQSNPNSSCSNSVTRTWTATDTCGNVASATQTILVNDTTSPTITQCAADVTVCGNANIPAPDISLVQATDNCGSPVITVLPDTVTGTCPQIITRVYVATDACGNQTPCSQTITVNCGPVCTLTLPNPLPECGSTSNALSGPAGLSSYSWSDAGSSAGWTITAGADTQTITYSAGTSGTGVFTLTTTNAEGCSSMCQLSVSCGTTPPPPGIGCRVTGGGTVAAGNSESACSKSPPAKSAKHGGQVGAPVGVPTPFSPASACIRGEWNHSRQGSKNGPAGSFHAAGNGNVHQFDSLMCACLPCPENPGATGTVGTLCNPGDRVCGPTPRQAPANKICFSGVGDYTFTKGQKSLKAVFRVDVEDRGEPGGRTGTQPPDRYRIRLWILNPACGRGFDADSDEGRALRMAVTCSNPLTEDVDPTAGAPDIDDGGDLLQGNQQIHPLTGATCP